MSPEVGEIKAGIVITALLDFFEEIFVSRSKSKEGEIKYQIDGPNGPLCRFRLSGERVVFLPESSFGDKEIEVKNLIEKRVGNVQFNSSTKEDIISKSEIKISQPIQREMTTSEPIEQENRIIIPDVPGIIDSMDRKSGSTIQYEGQDYEMKTFEVPIPSTSYTVSLGTYQKNWAVGITRGRKVIGVEKIPSLDTNIIIGAVQKIIVIPLFSPYAASRAVQRLLDQINKKS